jgi:RHS repeat-associated protein
MSARYMNPVASRWASSDPEGWGLVNPMEKNDQEQFQIRSGFSIVESMNPYSYVSNSPIIKIDPTGNWELKLGFGNGLAGKLRMYGDGEGNWDIDVAIGAGYGAIVKLDISPKEVKQDKLSVEASATGAISAFGELGLDLDVALTSESGASLLDLEDNTDISLSYPIKGTGGSSDFTYDVKEGGSGEYSQGSSWGEEIFVFIGMGDNLDEW